MDASSTPPTPTPEGSKSLICGPKGDPISSVDDWLAHAPPKLGARHWVDGRSAKELAKAWCRTDPPSMPSEFAALLEQHQHTRGFTPISATPELVTQLDRFRGEHRNHDLVVDGQVSHGRTVLCIEAKADESFGDDSVASYYRKRAQTTSSKVPARIRGLIGSIFGSDSLEELPPGELEMYPGALGVAPSPAVGGLPYQLLTAVGGTLIESTLRKAGRAVFVVHEFTHRPDAARGLAGTQDDRVLKNRRALESLVDVLPGSAGRPPDGDFLVGPFEIPGGGFVAAHSGLLVGKVTTHLR